MKTILIAEDDRNLALLYEQELVAEGYRVEVVHGGREAIERVATSSPDLLILDIRMPGIDGIEAMHQVRAKNRSLPVILNTAYSNHQDNFMTWSADAYVVKSSDLTELKSKIRELLGTGQHSDPEPYGQS